MYKIAFVLDDGLDSTDGVQQYILTLGNWLQTQGHTVHYIVGQTSRRDVANVHSLSRNVRVRFNQNRLTIPLGVKRRQLKLLLQKERYDVLHVQLPYSPQFAAKIIKAAGPETAVVGTFHIVPFSWLETTGSKLLSKLLKKSLARFDYLMSVSTAAQAFAKQTYGISSDVVPNVIDVRKFRSKRKFRQNKKTQLVFLGRLVARKGALEFVRALSLLPPQLISDIEVTIGGKGPLEKKLRTLVQESGLQHVVELKGYISEDEKPNFLGQADIAVFPALGGESFGIVLLEAMASGAGIVIGGNNEGYKTVLGDWPETLIQPTNAPGFAEVLATLIKDSSLRQRIHAQQQRAVELYDVPRVGQRIVKNYGDAIEKRRRKQHTKP